MATHKRQIMIIGAGPSGLAAAMLFHDYGWEDIIVIERSETPSSFQRGKAFNYQIDPRGQRLLERLNIAEGLKNYGLPNDDFKLTFVKADGDYKVIKPPIIVHNRGTAYWTRRNDFIKMLQDALERKNNDARIRLFYGCKFERFEICDDSAEAIITKNDGTQESFSPDIVIGCDGLNSAVRKSLKKLSGNSHFSMIEYPSPASQLAYKVLNFPSKFTVQGELGQVDNHKMAFAFLSRHKTPKDAFSFFALPVAKADAPRSINLIRLSNHNIWKIEDGETLLNYLEDALPQIDIRTLISPNEAEEFAKMKQGRFPIPQYSDSLYTQLGQGAHSIKCLLIGDSAHSFPPDLGLGVNSALEDLFILDKVLQSHNQDITQSFKQYEKEKIPQNASLVRLVQKVHPYQYNQVPWRLKLWIVNFLLRKLLNKISFGLIDPHAFVLIQNYRIPYSEVERRKKKSDFIVTVLGLLLFMILIFSQ